MSLCDVTGIFNIVLIFIVKIHIIDDNKMSSFVLMLMP